MTAPNAKLICEYQMPTQSLQQAFLDWYAVNHTRFAYVVQFEVPAGGHLTLYFGGINRVLYARFSLDCISVWVDYQGECWDCVFDVDAAPIPVTGGYICTMCKPETRVVFPDRLTIWVDHLFKPLLKWVNEDLAQSNCLVLEGAPGWTSARLTIEQPTFPRALAPDGVRLVIPLTQPTDTEQ